ncbi:polyprenyl synthetase family protein [Streptomyces sp. 2P-4]|uniref:polyprenyl synthetase family protein n=1 Tax=Streptomyces sp. 2P-4 TaxID=2931974 RepID=UPI002541B354|nr:polyprenyl synthetase family protein [Streptomyces sp. 2P-4]
MHPLPYADLRAVAPLDIEAELDAAVRLLGPEADTRAARGAVAGLLRRHPLRHPLWVLPLLVHGAQTGDPAPAAPLAALHVLWWTSACHLDDLADAPGRTRPGEPGPDRGPGPDPGPRPSEELMAAFLAGSVLPLRIVEALPAPPAVRAALASEILTAWTAAAQGQLADIGTDAAHATRGSAVAAYRGKSGGPFAMIASMAAELSGAERQRVDSWREFGTLFGILWQLFNDQEDILTGRHEDLRNGTPTYLLACALEGAAPPAGRDRLLTLCGAARVSAAARSELLAALLAPAVLRRYGAGLGAFRARTHRVLAAVGGHERYLAALRRLVDHASALLLPPAAAAAAAATARPTRPWRPTGR